MPRVKRPWKVWVERCGKNWRCRWEGVHGQGQQPFVFKDDAKELALFKKRDLQRQDAGLPPLHNPKAKGPDFAAFKEKYLAWLLQRRAAGTHRNARFALNLWLEFASGRPVFPVTIREKEKTKVGMTVAEFSDWLMIRTARRLPGHRANGTRIVLRHFKAACRWAFREGIIDYDPFLFFEMPAAVAVGRVLNPGDLVEILRDLPDLPRRAVYFTLNTGFRVSEVTRADWRHHEIATEMREGKPLEVRYLTVVKSKTRRNKPQETKTQQLHANAIAVMGEPKESGLIFDVKPAWLQRRLRRSYLKLGVRRVRWHDLRHTWATNFMEEIRDLKALMDAGGWATHDAAMVYQHGTKKRVAATAEVHSQFAPEPRPNV